MAILLSIETSTSVCSAALHKDGVLIAEQETQIPQSAASRLAIQIEDLLTSTGISRESLSAVAVSSGPGSYTGLRIGAATAKGICYGLKIPLIAINSLLILATGIKKNTDLLCPMIDARRMEVYCCLLNPMLEIVEETHARIIDSSSFEEHLSSKRILFFGDGSEKCKGVINHAHAVFLENVYPSASNMGIPAFKRFLAGEFADDQFEPRYLKEFLLKTKSA